MVQNLAPNNYIVSNIMNKVTDSFLEAVELIWTPNHIFAKQATRSGTVTEFEYTPSRAFKNLKNVLFSKWNNDYREVSLHKGTFFMKYIQK